MRDNFTQKTIFNIARRVAYLCSNPHCKRHTIGPQAGSEGSINVGVAAHISAASVGGPRYDASLNADERRNASNGVWLCQTCSKLIDSDEKHFTVKLLREWKGVAEEHAFVAIASNSENLNRTPMFTAILDEADRSLILGLGLPTNDDIDAVTSRMLVAAKADVLAFKSVREWPRYSIPLNLRTSDNGGIHAVNVAGLALAIATTSVISLVAAPGTGKSTTLVQVAEAILSSGAAIAAIIPLAEWSSRSDTIFQSLTHRNSFQGFREQHFMLLAYHGRLVLLLDGWNELDPTSRSRAIHELNSLRRDYPLLGLVVSTRRQSRDVPVSGPTIEIEALSEEQQLEIARAIRGNDGEALLDQAWRTPGVRELISVPLYLNALLANASSGMMPTTKEEVLRLFVTEHENSPTVADVLERELLGFHREFLESLAIEATQTANTTIQDNRARMVVSQAEDRLIADGQVKTPPQPAAVLDVLVSQHTLIRSSVNGGVSFQHQQFQEWYSSFEVERSMLAAVAGDVEAGKRLAAEILDMPLWEESILFACDRLSRADQTGVRAIAAAILHTLSIDPMLAAEMIYRAFSTVWALVKDEVIAFANRWHKPGTVDRASRFMIITGRSEFAQQIWPLVTNTDMQVQLSALRVAHRFRPSVLGGDLQMQITEIPENIREHLLVEIASDSGIDGIELATLLAKKDPSSTIQCAVREALLFRRADRFSTDILMTASDDVWKTLARKGYANEITDADAAARLQRERQSYFECEANALTKVRMLVEGDDSDQNVGRQIATLIESEDYPVKADQASWILKRAFELYPDDVGKALLNRIQAGRELPYRGEDLLRNSVVVDEGPISDMVIECARDNRLANTVAVIVGPRTVGILIDRFLLVEKKLRDMERPIDDEARDEYYRLMNRISSSRIGAFLEALQSRIDTKDPQRINVLADLFARHGNDVETGPLQAETSLIEPIASSIHSWIEVMVTSPQANRHQFASVVRVIERLPKPEFVDGLSRLLAEDLSRWQCARLEFFARPTRGLLSPDVTHTYTNLYRQAFAAISDDQVFRLMEKYLSDPTFGFDSACVLKEIWKRQQQDVPEENRFKFGAESAFSEVKIRHRQRNERGLSDTSPHAEAIFAVIEQMARPDCTEEDQRHALKLARIALSLPHGDKRSVINSLLSLPLSTLEKHDLLLSLALAGETISAETVLEGLRDLLEEAKQKPWLVNQEHGVEEWVELLPYSDRPAAIYDAFSLVDISYREPWRMRRLLSALGNAPDEQAEQLLGGLASRDPRFYNDYEWLKAIVGRGTASSAMMLLDLICDGKLTGDKGKIDGWTLARDLGCLIRNYPEMRGELYRRYEGQVAVTAKSVIEDVIAELADIDGLLILLRGYSKDGRSFDGTLHHLIERVALGKQPLADWGDNAYEIYGVNTTTLRKRLFAMIVGGKAEAELAEACLVVIDELRDEHGRIDSESRHPDITSGLPWPLVA